ncbi:MAG: UDP-N-acetylmuramate dehydrogenase, partial [bacterium]|nr:UDP-N-acetylmuramate dehydrogenase [bacterium]
MFQENVPLSQYSNYKIGGPARFFIEVKSVEETITAVQEAKRRNLSIFILGGSTNLLISDDGFSGLVIKVGFSQIVKNSESLVVAGAGVLVKNFLNFGIENSLSGFEWAGGLPGTMGGAVWGNAGAFGGEMKDSVVEVVSIDLQSGTLIKRTNAQCQFGYRNSIFKINTIKGIFEVIAEITIRVKNGDKEAIRSAMAEKINYRVARQPLDYPNIGSIFKNIDVKRLSAETLKKFEHKIKMDPFPVLPTAVLIDAAGLKERAVGGAMVSPKHPNFIINATGKATAAEVKALMEIIRAEIKKQFG